MAVVRRVYLYGIAFVAVWMLAFGAAGLLEAGLARLVEAFSRAVEVGGADTWRSRISFNGALGAIGLIAWLIHWLLADRAASRPDARGEAERGSGVRKLYLYAVLLVGGIILTINGRDLIADGLRLALGQLSASSVITGSIIGPICRLAAVGLFWLYTARVTRLDRASQPEAGAGATLRRWCGYGLSCFGLFVALFAAAGLVQLLVEAVMPLASSTGTLWLPNQVAERVAGLSAGLVCWLAAWSWTNRWPWTAGDDPEQRSTLRKVYLYLVLAVTIAWTLWNVGQVLYRLLLAALIPANRGASLAGDLGYAVGAAVIFGVAWLFHGRVVRREAAEAAQRREIVIRWLYGYLLALIAGLTAGYGVAALLATLGEQLVLPTGAGQSTEFWLNRLAFTITLVAVGLPVWVTQWVRLQREAASTPVLTRGAALVRRLYFFAVFAAAVLTLLVRVVMTLYGLFQLLLGEPWVATKAGDLIESLAYSLVAAVFLAYHLRIFRADAASGERAEAITPAAALPADWPFAAVVVVRAADPESLARLRRDLASQRDGLSWQMVDVDRATAERLLAEVQPAP